jgi:uncharacterized repeat protein (TIGR01451 family)
MSPKSKYLLLALPLLTFCSCKGLSVPFKPLFPSGDAAAKVSAPTTTTPTATTAAASIEQAPAQQGMLLSQMRKPIGIPERLPSERPPRLVQPVGYYPGINAPAMTLPDSAYTGQPAEGTHQMHEGHGAGCACCGGGGPFRFSADQGDPYGGWMPDGIKKPWPADEYICDGGDLGDNARVKYNWDVVGLEPEDTIAHFDTVDGKTEVVASNKCCIYAPRFAAVRRVINPVLYEGHERMAGVEKPTRLGLHQELGLPTTAVQPEQVVADLHIDAGVEFRERTRGIGVDNVLNPVLARGGFMLHENLKFIQRGVYEGAEKAVLAEGSQAALVWQTNQAVQVVIDGQMAHEAKGRSQPEALLTFELEGKGRLRICKIASNCDAQVGEIIEFTLRFDNVGDQKIGNVTIIDHLTPRLEYIENTQSSTAPAEFKMQINPDTLVLRWEITDPLEVGQGGVIRFRCKVR